MKKLIIAALALISFSAVSFSQTTAAAKKTNAPKVQTVKKPSDQQSTKAVAYNKEAKQPSAVASTKAKQATPAAKKTDAAATSIKKHKAKKSSTAHLKNNSKASKTKS